MSKLDLCLCIYAVAFLIYHLCTVMFLELNVGDHTFVPVKFSLSVPSVQIPILSCNVFADLPSFKSPVDWKNTISRSLNH